MVDWLHGKVIRIGDLARRLVSGDSDLVTRIGDSDLVTRIGDSVTRIGASDLVTRIR